MKLTANSRLDIGLWSIKKKLCARDQQVVLRSEEIAKTKAGRQQVLASCAQIDPRKPTRSIISKSIDKESVADGIHKRCLMVVEASCGLQWADFLNFCVRCTD